MMTSKLALHFQQLPGWAGNTAARWVKVMDPPSENRWPGKLVIGRAYMPDEDSNRLVAQGAAGAEQWFRFLQPYVQRSPWVHCWEGPNEPQPVADLAFATALGQFTRRLAELMHAAGLKVVGGCLSEGNPGGDEAQRRACFVEIAKGLQHCDYWSQHCYWVMTWPSPEAGMNDWHAFRYRMNLRYAAEAGIQLPPLLITECGVDGGVVGIPKHGWKSFCPTKWIYMEQLRQFDAQLAADPYVQCATVFSSGPTGDWSDFEVDQELAVMIDSHIADQGGPYLGMPAQPTQSLAAMLRAQFGSASEDLTDSLPKHATLTYTRRPLSDITGVVVHHTATSRATIWRTVARYHVETNGWPGIGYHVGIRLASGKVTVSLLNQPETRSYHAHAEGNDHGLALCIMGSFDKTQPEQSEIDAAGDVVAVIREFLGRSIPVLGHRDIPGNSTDCPGDLLEARLGEIAAPQSGGNVTTRVFDKLGNEQSLEWLAVNWDGCKVLPARIPPGAKEYWRLAEVHCTVSTVVLGMSVRRGNLPAVAQPVVMTYPTLENPSTDLPALPQSEHNWAPRGDMKRTNSNGLYEFELGRTYGPFYAAWVVSSVPSDCLSKTGMKGSTDHEGPLHGIWELSPTAPVYPTLHEALLGEGERAQAIQFNPAAALQKAIFAAGFVPNSPEFQIVFAGHAYVGQRAERLGDGAVRVYYALQGDWTNTTYVARP